jgi:hypothetical protein
MKTLYEINKHLFYQFDFEYNGVDINQVRDDFPFKLEAFGLVNCNQKRCHVYKFSYKRRIFIYIEDGQTLRVDAKFSITDLQNKILGEEWIYSQKPIDLNTSDFTDELLPSAIKRREMLKSVYFSTFPDSANITILEGHYLKKSAEIVGLIRDNKTSINWMVGSSFSPIEVESKVHVPESGISFVLAVAIGKSLVK